MKEVAKTYENMERLGSPFTEDGKAYINIKYPCCNNKKCKKCNGEGFYSKKVRWYGEVKEMNVFYRCLGFAVTGYVYIFAGDEQKINDFFLNHVPRHYGYFCTFFGWYLPRGKEIPENLPEDIIPIKLNWEDVNTEEKLLSVPKKIKQEKLASLKK